MLKNNLLTPYLLKEWIYCEQTCKYIASIITWRRFRDIDPIFKVKCGFILKGGYLVNHVWTFPKRAKYIFRQDKVLDWF